MFTKLYGFKNYCIGDNIGQVRNFCIAQSGAKDGIDDTLVYLQSDEDNLFINEDGLVAVQGVANNLWCPDLMGGGKHFYDIPNKNSQHSKIERAALYQFVIDSHKT